jgi:hypothetical protein
MQADRQQSPLKSMLPPMLPMPDTLKGIDDLIRSGLEGFAADWFWRLIEFTFMVAIGLLFEFPEIRHETIGALKEICHCPQNKRELSPLAKLAGTLGWVLIVAGVVGEGVAEGFLFKADGLVLKFDEILLSDTQRKSALANERAAQGMDKLEDQSENRAEERIALWTRNGTTTAVQYEYKLSR